MPPTDQNREILLPPGTYAYLQKEGSGVISVHVGPCAVNATGQDRPVRYDAQGRKYHNCSLDSAVQQCPRAAEGDYLILEEPAEEDSRLFPGEANNHNAKRLKKGVKIVIPGPWTEALWPGQAVQVLQGHRLRSNQYLVACIYNEEQAQANWTKAITKAAEGKASEGTDTEKTEQVKRKGLPASESFAVGTRIVIRGTDVSFYIPPTGVEVLRDESTGDYIREAVTLEQLEYCCLIGEDGRKQYPKGPDVIFPEPNQIFDKDGRGRRKFRPIELNRINGIHLKVTADFIGPDMESESGEERHYKEGEELFVTGKTLQIYYPREELTIIEYGQGNRKHYATAIPEGEGRYVIERETGVITTTAGPKMLLPDPRTEIIVRRILSDDECELMYPGNTEAKTYNRTLAGAAQDQPSGRSGFVSEGDWRKQIQKSAKRARRGGSQPMAAMADYAALESFDEDNFEPEDVGDEGGAGNSMVRGTQYTQPRRLTLNTKYDGVPKIEIWSGSAVLIVGASEEKRRVEIGPKTILLDYDEKLGFMNVSTGKPKTTDNTFRIGYLQVHQNQVGDIIDFESKDHVRCRVKISLRVNFEGETSEDRLKWFSVDNYVKYLCDHVRSVIAGTMKRYTVADIKAGHVDILRDCILGANAGDGEGRPGMLFTANNMRVVELEVFPLELLDHNIAALLIDAETETVRSDIELARAQKQLTITQEQQKIAQARRLAEFETTKQAEELSQQEQALRLQTALARLQGELEQIGAQTDTTKAQQARTDIEHSAELNRRKATNELELDFDQEKAKIRLEILLKETEAAVSRFKAAEGPLSEALMTLQRDDIAAKLAEATTIERYLGGDSIQSSLANLLTAFPMLQQFLQQPTGGNDNRLTRRETAPTG